MAVVMIVGDNPRVVAALKAAGVEAVLASDAGVAAALRQSVADDFEDLLSGATLFEEAYRPSYPAIGGPRYAAPSVTGRSQAKRRLQRRRSGR